jgi:hypothetical protein
MLSPTVELAVVAASFVLVAYLSVALATVWGSVAIATATVAEQRDGDSPGGPT